MMSTDEVAEKSNLTLAGLLPLHDAIAILAADRSVLSWNHRAESLTGYSLEALGGRLDKGVRARGNDGPGAAAGASRRVPGERTVAPADGRWEASARRGANCTSTLARL